MYKYARETKHKTINDVSFVLSANPQEKLWLIECVLSRNGRVLTLGTVSYHECFCNKSMGIHYLKKLLLHRFFYIYSSVKFPHFNFNFVRMLVVCTDRHGPH